jgi:hypothetical protein
MAYLVASGWPVQAGASLEEAVAMSAGAKGGELDAGNSPEFVLFTRVENAAFSILVAAMLLAPPSGAFGVCFC